MRGTRSATTLMATVSLLVLLILTCGGGCASPAGGPTESLAQNSAPVMGGDHDHTNWYPYVGAMNIGGSGCTGTLVTPGYVLTAAHCVHDVQAGATVSFRYDALHPPPGPDPFSAVHNYGTAGPIRVRIAESDMSEWVDDDIARDMALVQLDARMRSALIAPLHVPGIGPDPITTCSLTLDMDGFSAILVGYGGGDWLRKSYKSDDWMREGTYGGALYQNAWFAPDYAEGTAYGASESGDSGGLLISQSGQLCGVNSGHIFGTKWEGPFLVPVVWTNTAAVDSQLSMAWLRNNLVDSGGRFIGECLPNEGDPALRDVDSDNDLLPDACDPCPWVPDADYRKTGVIPAFSDRDHDGVADECDLCPYNPGAFWEWDPNAFPDGRIHTRQPDDDGDHVGNGCDSCKHSNESNNLSDFKCCNNDSDCLSSGYYVRCLSFNEQAIGVAAGTCGSMKRCAMSDDKDADGVGDVCDNCPSVKNEFQDDVDDDGAGDLCDNCPGTDDTTLHGENLNKVYCHDYVDVYSKAAGDLVCKAVNPDSECVPPHNTYPAVCSKVLDTDKDRIGDGCDSCPGVYNSMGDDVVWPGPNCNIDSEKAEGIPYPYIGDACDREPCAWIRSWNNTGWALPPDIWAELPYQPILLPRDAPAKNPPVYNYGFMTPNATVGARFCVCGNGNTPATAQGCKAICPLDSSGYRYGVDPQTPGANWEVPHVTKDPTSTNYAPDLNVPIGPWMPSWVFHCAICPGSFDQSILELDPVDQRLILRTRESVLDATRSAGPGVLPVLTGVAPGSRWLTVEEGVEFRQKSGLSVAAVAMDAATVPLVVAETPEMFVVATRPILSLMAAESQSEAQPPLSPPSRSDFGAVLSATEQGVFVVGGVLADNTPAHDLWHYAPRTGAWRQTAIRGTMPEKVLAATYRYSDRSLFVVSEIALGPTRWAQLLQIRVATGESKVRGFWPRHKFIDKLFLSVGPEGEIVLIGSSTAKARYYGVILRSWLHGVVPAGGVMGKGVVGLRPTLRDSGLSVPIVHGARIDNDFIPTDKLHIHPSFGAGDCL